LAIDNQKTNSKEDISCERAVDSLIDLRNVLVETSQALRDLLFEIDTRGRTEAEQATEEILKKLKR
jgi:hypothetical protein